MKESTTRMLVHFKQSAGRARREILSQAPEVHPSRTLALGTGEGDHPRSRLRIIQQELPEPQWLFQRLDIPREARVRARSHGAGRTVEVRLPRQGRGGADRIIELNANGLPTSVKTFGPRGVVLDALTIHWQTIAGRAFPSDAILVQISRKNIVTTTIRYQAVRLNLDLSDTLFTQ